MTDLEAENRARMGEEAIAFVREHAERSFAFAPAVRLVAKWDAALAAEPAGGEPRACAIRALGPAPNRGSRTNSAARSAPRRFALLRAFLRR
jgi:hypothetical protein